MSSKTTLYNHSLEIEDNGHAIDFYDFGTGDLVCQEYIWVDEPDPYGPGEYGWWILGVGIDFPPWNINHKIRGVI